MAIETDVNGWPTTHAAYKKVESVVAATEIAIPAWDDIDATLLAVISEFQSPRPIGTGRNFSPVTETRVFDGNGYPELPIPDIVPGTTIAISIYGTPITDFALKNDYRNEGASVMVRNLDVGTLFNADLPPQMWITGHQNVHITATWGANVPLAVADAIACEAARRILTADQAGLTGAGQSVTFEKGAISTGAGALNMRTSILIEWGDRYRAIVESYRDKEAWKRKALARRMS